MIYEEFNPIIQVRMGKRGNEDGQLTKDDYERLEEENDSSDPGQFQRADADIIKRRRIVSASK